MCSSTSPAADLTIPFDLFDQVFQLFLTEQSEVRFDEGGEIAIRGIEIVTLSELTNCNIQCRAFEANVLARLEQVIKCFSGEKLFST